MEVDVESPQCGSHSLAASRLFAFAGPENRAASAELATPSEMEKARQERRNIPGLDGALVADQPARDNGAGTGRRGNSRDSWAPVASPLRHSVARLVAKGAAASRLAGDLSRAEAPRISR